MKKKKKNNNIQREKKRDLNFFILKQAHKMREKKEQGKKGNFHYKIFRRKKNYQNPY